MADEQVAVSETAAPSEQPEQQAQVSTWRDDLPEEIRSHKSLESISDVGALAKGYVHAQSMVGSDKIPIPGKWATDDDWNSVYQKLGRPEEPEGYEFQQGEGVDADQEMVDWFRKTAHNAGLNANQAQRLFDSYTKMAQSRIDSSEVSFDNARREAETELQKEWGKAFEQRVGFARGILNNFGMEDIAELQLSNGSRIGDNPDVIRMLSKVGQFINEKIGEDSISGVKATGIMAPDEAQTKLRELTAAGSPYWSSKHPEHDWYVQEALRLREFAG